MQQAKQFKSVCWNITSRCNEQCDFCYRDDQTADLSCEENKNVLENIIKIGVEKISLIGGEPLLYDGLFQLVEYGKSIDPHLIFSITTNGKLLVDNDHIVNEFLLRKVISHFDWITFSLEGGDVAIQTESGRSSQHFARVATLLNYLENNNCTNSVKINTVVSKKNIDFLQELADYISNFTIRRWKLMKFLPSRYSAKDNIGTYEVSEEQFDHIVNDLKKCMKQYGIKITKDSKCDYLKSYINISSNGELVEYNGTKYNKVFDFKKIDAEGVRISDYIDVELHNKKRGEIGAL
jgi:radical S-adenosyl methionine domain-containing protein 2